jgi:glyoxylase-like metal-dependent hydrolase (beta-lactamase superfamily II)
MTGQTPAKPVVRAFFDPATFTVSYVVHDPATRAAAIIDPVLDFTPRNGRTATRSADALLDYLRAERLDLKWLLETHAHADHLSAGHYLRERTGAPLIIGEHIVMVQAHFAALFEADDATPDGSQFDRLVADGDILDLGEFTIGVLHSPGHTPADVTYVIGEAAFIGDTLFMPDYGTARTDFPGGSSQALYGSIRRILDLPEATRLFVGHDYLPENRPGSRKDYRWETSVVEQRAANVHVRDGVSEAEFVALRETRNAGLEAPLLILPSLQVNIRAGALPPPTAKGHVFLRIPVNAI